MKEFLIYLLKSGVCLSIFLMIYHLILRKTTFFKLNRVFLILGLIISFLIPAATYTYDVVKLAPFVSPVENTDLYSNPTFSTVSKVDVSYANEVPIVTEEKGNIGMIRLYTIWKVLFAVYAVIVAIITIRFILMQIRFSKLHKSGKKTNYEGYDLINTPLAETPFAVFNTIYADMDRISDNDSKSSILQHETVHIKQRHWFDLVLGEIALTLQWFNPVMWTYIRRIKDNHEYLADEGVIKMGISPATYRAVLINERLKNNGIDISSPFKGANSLGRLAMMKKEKTAAWKRILILIIVPFLGVFLWVSAEPNYLLFDLDDFSFKVMADVTTIDKKGNVVKDGVSSNDLLALSFSGSYENSIPSSLRTSTVDLYAKQGKDGTLVIKTKPAGDIEVSSDELIKAVKSLPDIILLIDGKASTEGQIDSLNLNRIASVSYLINNKMITVLDDLMTISLTAGYGEDAPKLIKTDNLNIALADGYKQMLENAKNLPVVIEGKFATMKELKEMKPGSINILMIFTKEKYVSRYGDKVKHGIILAK